MNNITIVAIDSKQYAATKWVIDRTKKFFKDSPVLVVSDQNFYPDSKFVEVPKFDKVQHSRMCLDVGQLVETDYALFVQWDGMPINFNAWTDKFLEYDYIGAVWPWMPEGFQVGNGGFSLRSKKLLDLTPKIPQHFDKGHDSYWLEDGLIGIHYKKNLEDDGVKFAPAEIAKQFSNEHPIGKTNSFGFHHADNAKCYLNIFDYCQWQNLVLK